MLNSARIFLVLPVAAAMLAACNSSKPASQGAGGADAKMAAADSVHPLGLSKTPDPTVIAEHCSDGPGAVALTAMKDSAGYVGAYIFRRMILDSPVFYLDPTGKHVALFHIFGPPEEKKVNAPKIDSLRAAYPVEADIACPGAKAPGAP